MKSNVFSAYCITEKILYDVIYLDLYEFRRGQFNDYITDSYKIYKCEFHIVNF